MANTTADKINLLVDNKTSIKTAIESMNPEIAPTNVMSNWPRAIISIRSGRGSMFGHDVTFSGNSSLYGLKYYVYSTDGSVTAYSFDTTRTVQNVVAFYVETYRRTGEPGYEYYLTNFKITSSHGTFQSSNDLHSLLNHCNTEAYLITEECTVIPQGFNVYHDGGCLISGTMITLANMSLKPIEEITYDDELLVWDFDNGKISKSNPVWIKNPEVIDYYFINKLSSGKELITTGMSDTGWGHRMYDVTRNKFVYTTQSVSDQIYTLDGIETHMSCQRIDEKCEYYNIITKRHFNLFANGILTSCSLNNMYAMKDMKFQKDGRILTSREEFACFSDGIVDGLRLCEQKDVDVKKYVKKLINKMKPNVI